MNMPHAGRTQPKLKYAEYKALKMLNTKSNMQSDVVVY